MKRLIPIGCVVVAAAATTPLRAPEIPVRTLAPSQAVSRDTFGAILSLRHLPDGRVLVNDGPRRRVVRLDSMLANPAIVLDSAGGGANPYGRFAVPFMAYLGDSVLFPDVTAQVLLVIDPTGKVVRTMAPPNARDLTLMTGGNSATDPQGRIVYRVPMRIVTPQSVQTNPDSAVLVRADFVTRTVDTLTTLRTSTGRRSQLLTAPNGDRIFKTTINPLPQLDEWAMLSNGDIALVRGTDYHVDWIRADGSKASTPKMAFDWRKLTDDDKARLIDSAKAAFAAQQAAAAAARESGTSGTAPTVTGRGGGGMTVARAGGGDGAPVTPIQIKEENEFVPPSEIVDYYPPMRSGAARADRDGNLWILTATSAQSKEGELVYDVVNAKGELYQRVRFPVGKSLAGFGPNGVVYLMSGALGKGFVLEKTFLTRAS